MVTPRSLKDPGALLRCSSACRHLCVRALRTSLCDGVCKAASRRAGREQTKVCGESAAIGRLEKLSSGCLCEVLTIGSFCEEQCVPMCIQALLPCQLPAPSYHRLTLALCADRFSSPELTSRQFLRTGEGWGKIVFTSLIGQFGALNAQVYPHVRLPHALCACQP